MKDVITVNVTKPGIAESESVYLNMKIYVPISFFCVAKICSIYIYINTPVEEDSIKHPGP